MIGGLGPRVVVDGAVRATISAGMWSVKTGALVRLEAWNADLQSIFFRACSTVHRMFVVYNFRPWCCRLFNHQASLSYQEVTNLITLPPAPESPRTRTSVRIFIVNLKHASCHQRHIQPSHAAGSPYSRNRRPAARGASPVSSCLACRLP